MDTVRKRCINHIWRSRILGLRFSSTTHYTPPSTSSQSTTQSATSNSNITPYPTPSASQTPEKIIQATSSTPSPPTRIYTSQTPSSKDAILTPKTLHHYGNSTPPNPIQNTYTARYFQPPPLHIYTAGRFVQLPRSPHPEICFVGRSNVGKSSLLNALFGRPRQHMARVSSKPGRTRTINGFGVGGSRQASSDPIKALGQGAIVVVDMPGYGKGSRKEWGEEIHKYFLQRKQLRRVFMLVDSFHGVKPADRELMEWFKTKSVPFTIVLAKVDKLLFPGTKQPNRQNLQIYLERLGKVREGVLDLLKGMDKETGGKGGADVDLLCCSSEKEILGMGLQRGRLGVDAVRWEALRACGLECDEEGRKRTVEGLTILEDEDLD